MPIKIPDDPVLAQALRKERVPVIREEDALRQDIRALQILLVNIMPTSVHHDTATQFARLLGASPLQIELTLARPANYPARHAEGTASFGAYLPPESVRDRYFDGMIVTGAPIEHLPFEEVTYWQELVSMFDWATRHVHSTLGVCWGAQALLWHRHGVPKHALPRKAFGCFQHRKLDPLSPYLRGFSDEFLVPISRHTEVRAGEIPDRTGVQVLVDSDEGGLCLAHEAASRILYMFNHVEYDTESLKREYERDLARDLDPPIHLPCNYFPDDDPSRPPANRWRAQAYLLIGNWVHEVYQGTPYCIEEIETAGENS